MGLQAWLKYSRMQEVAAWVSVRALITRLKPAFALAVTGDPSVGEENPSLKQLFGVRNAIAQRAVSTRRANAANEANGDPQFSGAIGKRRKKKAANAALAAQEAANAALAAQEAANAASGAAPAAAPVATTVAPVAVTVPPTGSQVVATVAPAAGSTPVPATPTVHS